MPIVNANKTLTDELEIGRKLTVVVSSGGSASLRMYQAGQDLGGIQLSSGSTNSFGPFTSAINYAVDCFSGSANVNESQPSDDAVVLGDGPEEASVNSIQKSVKKTISKIFGNQAAVSHGNGLTAGASTNLGFVGKRELEIDAPLSLGQKNVKVRLWILSKESINTSDKWQVAIAPTETSDISTSSNAFNAIVGGRTIQYYASSLAKTGSTNDQLGYVRGTFGNSATSGILPAGGTTVDYSIGSVSGNPAVGQGASTGVIYSTAYGAICTDWMTIPLVPRSDTSPNGKNKALIQYRISKIANGADTFSQIGRNVVNGTGLSLQAMNYWRWRNGNKANRFDFCLATTAANYDVTNTLTLAPTLVDILAAPTATGTLGLGQFPYLAWEVDYSGAVDKSITVAGVGDSMTESEFSSVIFNGFISNGTSGVAGNILTVTGYAANSGGGLIESGSRIFNASMTQFPVVVDQQLTGTTGKQGTYSLRLSNNPPYAGGAVSLATGTSGSPVVFSANKNDSIESPALWWRDAVYELSEGNTVLDAFNLGHSTNRIESFTDSFINAVNMGQVPDVLIFPLSSVNNFNPLNDIMGFDYQAIVSNIEAVLEVCQKYSIKPILWNVPNYAAVVDGGSDEQGTVNNQLNEYARQLDAKGIAKFLDLQSIAISQANMNASNLVDGTHWNVAFQNAAKTALKNIISVII